MNFQFQSLLRRLRILKVVICVAIVMLFAFVLTRPVAAEEKKPASESVQMKQATDAAMQNNKYQLPYHGLLPDSPLYVLKTIRDRIIDFLIADNVKKADFSLLQAEKHTSMALALVEKGKPDMAESVAVKGVNFLDRAITIYKKAKDEGKDVTQLSTKFVASIEAQEEVLRSLGFNTLANSVMKHRETLQSQ